MVELSSIGQTCQRIGVGEFMRSAFSGNSAVNFSLELGQAAPEEDNVAEDEERSQDEQFLDFYLPFLGDRPHTVKLEGDETGRENPHDEEDHVAKGDAMMREGAEGYRHERDLTRGGPVPTMALQ